MNIRHYEDSFANGALLFGEALDNSVFTEPKSATTIQPNQLGLPAREGFIQLPGQYLPSFIGKILLSPNVELGAMSPAVLLPGANSDSYILTRLNQPFDIRVGASTGIKFGLSARAQSSNAAFGSHNTRNGFEAGHFSTVLLGALNSAVAQNIITNGDTATHLLIRQGVPETMSALGSLPLAYQTRVIGAEQLPNLPLFWHQGLEDEQGIVAADYPHSVQLMLGAGIAALDKSGIESTRRLIDAAISGTTS